jgi:hypothetical protein
MALTRTRTRTQTALTKLAQLLAEVNGELEVLEPLVASAGDTAARGILERHARLLGDRDALRQTLRQFDPSIDPAVIGATYQWLKAHGRGRRALERYRSALSRPD